MFGTDSPIQTAASQIGKILERMLNSNATPIFFLCSQKKLCYSLPDFL